MGAHELPYEWSQADWEIPDPGASGVIPGDRVGIVHIVSAGSESRTLAAPTKSGIELQLVGKTIVGTVTVTIGSSGSYNEAGDTNFTITAAGQFITLRSFEIAAGTFAWRRLAGDGVGSSASTTAAEVSIADAGLYTANTNVETALQELYLSNTGTGKIGVPLSSISKEDGTQMIKQATTVTGFAQLANKNLVIHIPANSTAEAFAFTAALPDDFKATSPLTLRVIVSKDANADTLTLDAEVYFLDVAGAAWSADGYAGAAVTITQGITGLSFAVASAAAVTDNPISAAVVLTLGGTNDGDVVYIHDVYFAYTKTLLTA